MKIELIQKDKNFYNLNIITNEDTTSGKKGEMYLADVQSLHNFYVELREIFKDKES